MTDVILNALEDVHIIVNQLRVMSRRLDAGIAFLPEVSKENGPLDTTEHLTNVQPTGLLTGSASDEMRNDAVCMKEREVMSSSEKTGDNLLRETTLSERKEYLNINDESERSKHDLVTVGYVYIIYGHCIIVRFTF